jgi:hypothetical protein
MLDTSNYLYDPGNDTAPRPAARHSMLPRAKATSSQAARIAAVRRFNRFYTRVVGALDEGGYLHSPFTLT